MKVHPIAGALGAEIGGIDLRRASDADIAEIRRIMVANGVTPPQRPPAKATNEEYGDGKSIQEKRPTPPLMNP